MLNNKSGRQLQLDNTPASPPRTEVLPRLESHFAKPFRHVTRITTGGTAPPTFLRTPRLPYALSSPKSSPVAPAVSRSAPARLRSAGASTRAGGRSGGSRPAGASIVARVLHQPPTRFDKALLETDQRPRVDPLREHQPPPEIPEVIGEHAQLQPDPTVASLRRRERN